MFGSLSLDLSILMTARSVIGSSPTSSAGTSCLSVSVQVNLMPLWTTCVLVRTWPSAEGHVLTNTHVVHNGIKFTCTLTDKQEVPAELVGEDPMTDLAVIKIDKSKLKDPNMQFAVGQFGDSDALKIGDHVMAMGSPFALSRSVTLGIVSNTERVFTGVMGEDDPDEFELMQNQRTGLFNRWIQ